MRLNVGSAVITEKFLTVVRRQRDEPYRGGPGAPPKSCKLFIIAVTPAEEWKTRVQKGLFPMLRALGADPACSNPGRLSRLPGMFRADSGKFQQLLFLAPEGGTL